MPRPDVLRREGLFVQPGKIVVGVRRHRYGPSGSPQAVPDAAVVLGAADQDADGFVVVLASEHVIYKRDIEVEFSGPFGLKLSSLELYNDVPGLVNVEKKHVDIKVVAVDVEVHLPADEGEARTEFTQRFGDSASQGVLQVALSHFAGQAQELKVVGVFGDLLCKIRVWSNKPLDKVRRCRPGALQRFVHDHVQQNISGPAIRRRQLRTMLDHQGGRAYPASPPLNV